jgi:hypothetical protein
MGSRNPRLRILSLLSLSLAFSSPPAAAQASQPAIAVRTAATHPPGHEAGPVALTWVFRGQDVFACQSDAYDLRAVLRTYASNVSARMVAVDADPQVVASFLRREGLNLRVSFLSAQEYRQAFHTAPVPGVSVTRGGQLVENLNTGQLQVRGRRDTSSLMEIVGQLVSPGGSARYSFNQR